MKYLNISEKIVNYMDQNYDKNDIFFLDILSSYMNTSEYIYILQNIEEYKYKNIINFINHKWIRSQNILSKKYDKIKYDNNNIKINNNITFEKFNDILIKFINNNIVIAIFTINIIEMYLF